MSAILGETEKSKFSFFLPFSSRPVQWVTKQVSSRGSVGSCQVGRFYSNVRGMVPRGRRYRAPGTEVDTRINRKSLEQRRVAATRPASDDISNASFSKFQNAPPPPENMAMLIIPRVDARDNMSEIVALNYEKNSTDRRYPFDD